MRRGKERVGKRRGEGGEEEWRGLRRGGEREKGNKEGNILFNNTDLRGKRKRE